MAVADRLVENSKVFLPGEESWRKPKKARPRADPNLV